MTWDLMRTFGSWAIMVVVLYLAVVNPVSAQSTDDTEQTRPAGTTFLGDTGLWFVPTAEILPSGTWSASAQRANFDRQEGITDIAHYLGTFTYGVNARVELFGSFRALTRIDRDVKPIFTSSSFGGPAHQFPLLADQYSGSQIGDLLLGGKVNLASEAMQSPVAFAIRGLVKLPTGNENNGTSTGKADGMFDLILSKDLGAVELSGFGGFAVRGDPSGIDLPNSFRWGIGAGIPAPSGLTFFGELIGEALTDDGLSVTRSLVAPDGSIARMMSDLRNPIDATLGLQWNAPSGLYVGAGLNFSVLHSENQAAGDSPTAVERLGFLVRIGFHPGVKVYVPPPPPPPPQPPNNRPPTVMAQCAPCEVLVGEESRVRANASDPDGDPLEYRWSAPVGTFQDLQNRETQRWQAPDESGRVPVTVTVNDGRGETTSDTVTITVTAPPPPPTREYVFEDVHFDFDRYTLRAGASQVLDEVAAAMEEDLTLRIQIEGHTCNIGTAEYNLALGERRANAVQDYLSSRGISTTRFETISYGEERPQHDNSREETRRFNRRAALVVRLIDLATAPSTTGDDHLDQVETPGLLDSAAVLSTVTTAVRVGVFSNVSQMPVDTETSRTLREMVTTTLASLDSIQLVSTDIEATLAITGGIQRVGNMLRLTASLIDVRQGSVVHAVKVDGPADQGQRLQSEIVDELRNSLVQ